MRVCICDDIVEYRMSIRAYAEQYFIEKGIDCEIEEFTLPEEVLSCEYASEFDIFFLDIEFGETTNGIDLIGQLQSRCQNAFYIVVTAYRQYLDEAMDLNVLRFIDKPIKQERINIALDKAIEVINNSIVIFESINGNKYCVNKKDIIYAEAKMRKSLIVTTQRNIICPLPFKYVKAMLSSNMFLIPHNSFIINKNYISAFEKIGLTLKHKENTFCIPISASKQKSVRESFNRL